MAESADSIDHVQSTIKSNSDPERSHQEGSSENGYRSGDEEFFDPDYNTYGTRLEKKLGRWSVFCLIVNRMIGTGIFEQPSKVLAGCGSLGGSLFVWTIGALVAFCGLMVHIEYGLVIPRDTLNREGLEGQTTQNSEWACFPRSGGEKNYFEFLFRRQKLLPVCIYGVIFVFLGNTAGNSITCADHILRVAGTPDPNQHEWLTKGIAIAVVGFACLMHSMYRTLGIYIINSFAIIKILILWAIVLLAIIARCGAFKNDLSGDPPAWTGLEPAQAFDGEVGGIYGWTIAILGVLFAFGGYENANYVLGDIKNPKQNFPPMAILAVVVVSISYISTIIAYYVVIPADEMFPSINNRDPKPVLLFFEKLFNSNLAVQKATAGLIALSSFGNLMTVTFIAARVKQEIAKEGIIYPYSFWRKEYNNLGLIIYTKLRKESIKERDHEKTPVPALLLHFLTSVILITAPSLSIAYTLFSRMQAYMIQACFGSILGLGLLYLRYFKPRRDPRFKWISLAEEAFAQWKDLSGLPPWLKFVLGGLGFKHILPLPQWILQPNFIYPSFYSAATLFLVIGPWIQNNKSGQSKIPQSDSLKWFVFPTVCLCLFPIGLIYWFIYDWIIPQLFKYELVRKRLRNPTDSRASPDLDWEGVKAKWYKVTTRNQEEESDEEDPDLPFLRSRRRQGGQPV